MIIPPSLLLAAALTRSCSIWDGLLMSCLAWARVVAQFWLRLEPWLSYLKTRVLVWWRSMLHEDYQLFKTTWQPSSKVCVPHSECSSQWDLSCDWNWLIVNTSLVHLLALWCTPVNPVHLHGYCTPLLPLFPFVLTSCCLCNWALLTQLTKVCWYFHCSIQFIITPLSVKVSSTRLIVIRFNSPIAYRVV